MLDLMDRKGIGDQLDFMSDDDIDELKEAMCDVLNKVMINNECEIIKRNTIGRKHIG